MHTYIVSVFFVQFLFDQLSRMPFVELEVTVWCQFELNSLLSFSFKFYILIFKIIMYALDFL